MKAALKSSPKTPIIRVLVKPRVSLRTPILHPRNARLILGKQERVHVSVPVLIQAHSFKYSTQAPKSLYDFSARDIDGKDVNMKTYSGKVLLIVNVASQCGLTKSNYTELQQVYDKHKSNGFEILAFPSNQFGAQEPGTNQQICEFARNKYKATFPMFEKIDVNGSKQHPLYKFLKEQAEENKGQDISWNFEKFLIDKEGNIVRRYNPKVNPAKIEADIQSIL